MPPVARSAPPSRELVVTNATGARHASFRFVAGELDPMSSRELFLATARRVADPILVVYGAATPRRSKAEMEALRNLPHVQFRELPVGKLAVHEEFSALVADAVRSFIGQVQVGSNTGRLRVGCPLWVKSRHVQRNMACPLSANSGHSLRATISACVSP